MIGRILYFNDIASLRIAKAFLAKEIDLYLPTSAISKQLSEIAKRKRY